VVGPDQRGRGDRQRLITAAERLFAEHGIDSVTLRQIIRAAGVKHAAAIQYHFAGRDGLIEAALEEPNARVETRRNAMLDEYEANGRMDIRALSAILVRPLAAELTDISGRFFLQIFAQVMLGSCNRFTDTRSSYWRWRTSVEPCLPAGTAELHPRLAASEFALVELARRASQPPHSDDRIFISRTIDLVAGILTVPLSEETERLLSERNSAPGATR